MLVTMLQIPFRFKIDLAIIDKFWIDPILAKTSFSTRLYFELQEILLTTRGLGI